MMTYLEVRSAVGCGYVSRVLSGDGFTCQLTTEAMHALSSSAEVLRELSDRHRVDTATLAHSCL